MEEVAAGLDIGTSGLKLVLYGRRGLVYSARRPHSGSLGGGREFEPEKLLSDVTGIIRKAVRAKPGLRIAALGFSTVYPSLIAVDKSGRPLTRVLTWLDERGAAEAAAFRGRAADALHRRTGCPPHGSHQLWKLRWLRRHKPAAFKAAAKFLSLPDYLVSRLTGKCAVSRAVASSTGLLNLRSGRWDAGALALAGVKESQLPELVEMTADLPLAAEAAALTGLPPDAIIAPGAGDGQMAIVGAGCRPGEACTTVGTSSAVRIAGPLRAHAPAAWRYRLCGDRFIAGVPSNAGLATLSWAAERLLGLEAGSLPGLIARLEPEPGGPLCLPFQDGERGPGYTPGLAASFSGLSSAYSGRALLKAAAEGVFFNLYQCLCSLCRGGGLPRSVVATGGYVNSPFLLQLQADVFGMTVKVPACAEASASGAAAAALTALGKLPSVFALPQAAGKSYRPEAARHRGYRARYLRYLRLYAAARAAALEAAE